MAMNPSCFFIFLSCGLLFTSKPTAFAGNAEEKARTMSPDLSNAALSTPWVSLNESGKLRYRTDGLNNTIPDFSRAGYRGGGVPLPEVAVVKALEPVEEGDDGERIQAALNEVATGTPDAQGRKGALLLKRGNYRIAGSLTVPGGVTLRGESSGEDGTVIIATGRKERGFITVGALWPRPARISGITPENVGTAQIDGTERKITQSYVPWSERTLRLEHLDGLSEGDRVAIFRPGTAEWIATLGMDRIERSSNPKIKLFQWTPETYGFLIERFIVAIDHEKKQVTLDAPLMIALDENYGGGVLSRAQSRRAVESGIESVRLVCEYRKGQEFKDVEHARSAVIFSAVENAWARDVVALHFNLGFQVARTSMFVTIKDSAVLDPVGPVKGGYRYGFHLNGQYSLVENAHARMNRHAFSTGYRARGPNVFLNCVSEQAQADSGPHERFAIGTLYDNIADDYALVVQDRGNFGTGHGWSGAQQVFWNCDVAKLIIQQPPTAQNYAIGCKAKEVLPGRFPDRQQGIVESPGLPVEPQSLYRTQLEERLNGK